MRTATTRIMEVAALTLVLTTVGCSPNNRIVASRVVEAGDWYGELGITGHLNQITVNAPSDITKLSIIGDANVVHVKPLVTLGKIEIWGERNKVYIPARLIIRASIFGDGSEIIRLQPGQSPRFPGTTGAAPPPMEAAPMEQPAPMQESAPMRDSAPPANEPSPSYDSSAPSTVTIEPAN